MCMMFMAIAAQILMMMAMFFDDDGNIMTNTQNINIITTIIYKKCTDANSIMSMARAARNKNVYDVHGDSSTNIDDDGNVF